MSEIEQIIELWKKIPANGTKTKIIKKLAKELGRSPNTLRNHWFGSFWLIPEAHQAHVKKELENSTS
jgi:hypothetical protein